MNNTGPSAPVIQIIWTREIDGKPMAGRLRVAHALRKVLCEAGEVHEYVMTPNIGGRLSSLLGAFAAIVSNLLTGRVLPLQCALYASPREIRRVLAAVAPSATVIYLDGVRTVVLLEALRARYPDKRIVVDFDDLMSRRMALLRKVGEPLSPGYLMQQLPPFLIRQLLGPVGKLVSWYEAATLPRIEAEICQNADAVVLLSKADMDFLPAGGKAERFTIPPAVALQDNRRWPLPGPLRCAFVGTDALTQNRLTIDYLLDLWRRYQLKCPLVIVGIQHRTLDLPATVTRLGYVDSIEEIYDGRTILITPTFLAGGVKTKVLEGFAHGAPVVGNKLTFEAMPMIGYPLQIDDEAELVAFVGALDSHRARADAGVAFALDYIANNHSAERFAKQWLAALGVG